MSTTTVLRPISDGDPGSWQKNGGVAILWDAIDATYSSPDLPADTSYIYPAFTGDNAEINFDYTTIPDGSVISNCTLYVAISNNDLNVQMDFQIGSQNQSLILEDALAKHWEAITYNTITSKTQLDLLSISNQDGFDLRIYNLYLSITYDAAPTGILQAGKPRKGVTLNSGINI